MNKKLLSMTCLATTLAIMSISSASYANTFFCKLGLARGVCVHIGDDGPTMTLQYKGECQGNGGLFSCGGSHMNSQNN